MDLFTPWLVLAVLFYSLRQLEVWLHQHIFKVGWLVTKQYQTTTILYYAFFLPGIILNQFIFWLAAGFLNVSAERSIAWPQKQEIGELKLDFIRLSKNVSPLPFALISTAPLLVGLFAVWQIANNVLNVPTFLTNLNTGGFLVNLSPALSQFTNAPDFWIWVYLAFAISNTMMPNFANLRGWRIVLTIVGILIAALYVLGAGDQVVMSNLRGPVTDALNSLSSVFAIIIGLDIFMVVVLGTIEAVIERITGDSATFENGKMVTLRRSELVARRQQALATRPQPRSQRAAPAPVGPPSVYKLNFPIPGAPGKEAVSVSPQMVISQEPKPALPPQPDSRSGPAVISGTVTEKLPPPSTSPQSSPIPSNPATPMSKPAASGASTPPASPAPFNKPATPAAPQASPFNKPAAPASSGTPPATTSPFNKPAAPASGSTPPTTTSPFNKPAAPASGSTSSTSPFNKPATPMGSPTSPPKPTLPGSTSPATSTGTFKPATPIGSTPVAPNPVSSIGVSPTRPVPKPVSPFAAANDVDDEDEIDDVDDDNDEDEDDEISYEDFEDPA